jgi:glycosyltransferase involved in cell wall biosynthesis
MIFSFAKNILFFLSRLMTPIGKYFAILRNRQDKFKYELAVCAIFKDEAPYLEEWLIFHQGVGVDHFYLYNDSSTDEYMKVLDPWIKSGKITLKNWNRIGQTRAYNDCIRCSRKDARWVAFIDLDEFLFSPTGVSLPQVLTEYYDVSSLFVYWVLFGSSGHYERPGGSVIESYTMCLDHDAAIIDSFDHGDVPGKHNYVSGWAQDGKSIVNPRLVRKFNIHKPKSLWFGEVLDEKRQPPRVRGEATSLSYEKLRINHYWSKSISELTNKVSRGSVCDPNRPPRKLHRWLEREAMLNRSKDKVIIPIWKKIVSN